MQNPIDFSGKPFHFIGIGGIGMSALAYILARRDFPVSGSDVRLSHITQRLQEQGVHIFWRQDADNIDYFQKHKSLTGISSHLAESDTLALGSALPASSDTRSHTNASSIDRLTKAKLTKARQAKLPQIICSTAIDDSNSEYSAALAANCPIFHRSDLLAALIQDYHGIAVAGTHGKTTTSSLIGYLLLAADLDPTIIVGGEVAAWEGNARLGQGPYLVAEADESDGSLVKLSTQIGVVTNIELDHPDHYTDLSQVGDIFKAFAQRCQTLIGCIDCPNVRQFLRPTISYSLDLDSGADYAVDCVNYRADGITARVWEQGQILGQLNLKLLGQHNLRNALAAVAVGRLLGLEFSTIARIVLNFEGARRRFECRGRYNDILFVDDYAHHPTEIQATLAAARIQVENLKTTAPSGRLVAIFQPHRYSRAATFLSEFAAAFQAADQVVVTDIYSAGEPDTGRVTNHQVVAAIAAQHPDVVYQPCLKSVCQFLTEVLLPGDIAVFLGAGNLNQIIPEVMAFYQQIEQSLSKQLCNQA
ncbi:MAG: UDP-N-acetylmuramate--L-alanine ligase [Cyanothece sp. SIO1E1]|nr:UDP-N-acetylmuramate--L-alanine ligase [Cyanothece sp. SIO1E1]